MGGCIGNIPLFNILESIYPSTYLRKLDALSLKISNWGDVVPHEGCKAELRQIHARKNSFWSRYGA